MELVALLTFYPQDIMVSYCKLDIGYFPNILRPIIRVIRKTTRNRKKKNFAILAAPSAIPPKPNIAATIAMMKKIADHFNMFLVFNVFMNNPNVVQMFGQVKRRTYLVLNFFKFCLISPFPKLSLDLAREKSIKHQSQ